MVRLRVRSAIPNIFYRAILLLACVAGLMWTAAACSKDGPTAPSAPTPTFVGLEVRGCAENEGYQCRAFLVLNNNERNEVSAQTTWESNNWQIARADATGRVTPRGFVGSVTFRGIYKGRGVGHMSEGTQKIDVTAPPVVIHGTVREPSGRPVVGAEVRHGSITNGTIIKTDGNGYWALPVVPTLTVSLFVTHLDYHSKSFLLGLDNGIDISALRHLELLPWRTYPAPTAPSPAPTPPSPPPPPPDQITES
jgi:hypothetical protein